MPVWIRRKRQKCRIHIRRCSLLTNPIHDLFKVDLEIRHRHPADAWQIVIVHSEGDQHKIGITRQHLSSSLQKPHDGVVPTGSRPILEGDLRIGIAALQEMHESAISGIRSLTDEASPPAVIESPNAITFTFFPDLSLSIVLASNADASDGTDSLSGPSYV